MPPMESLKSPSPSRSPGATRGQSCRLVPIWPRGQGVIVTWRPAAGPARRKTLIVGLVMRRRRRFGRAKVKCGIDHGRWQHRGEHAFQVFEHIQGVLRGKAQRIRVRW